MKLFVWDFHGVIERYNERAVIYISNLILQKNGFKERFSEDDVNRLYGLKWYQFFEYLLPGLPKDDYYRLQEECLSNQSENYKIIKSIIKPTEHVIDVLSKIKNSHHQQILISNTRPNDIIWFLESVGAKELFDKDKIFGVNAHQTASSKMEVLKSYIGDRKIDKIICIGDSISDLELGRSVGAVNYFYKHPYLKHESTDKADHIINDLRQILKEL